MTATSKFIDFFVHDILDYTMLVDKGQNFTKALSVFEIRAAIKEIIKILEN